MSQVNQIQLHWTEQYPPLVLIAILAFCIYCLPFALAPRSPQPIVEQIKTVPGAAVVTPMLPTTDDPTRPLREGMDAAAKTADAVGKGRLPVPPVSPPGRR